MVAYVRGERAVATRHGDAEKPMYITEYGWATSGNSTFIVTTQECQAALLYAATAPKGVRCGDDCSHEFQPGGVVTLTATPEVGSAFTGWTGAPCSGTNCVVTMDTAMKIGASFALVAKPGTYQQGKPPIAYTGVWKTSPDIKDSGGSSKVATTGPASATMLFEGSGVRWMSRKTPSSGVNRVFVDGLRVATVDGYSSSVRHQVMVFDSGTLEPGQHSIRIEYTGRKRAAAKDNKVILDAFVVR